MLGILKADACYVPLDTASPAPRIAKIVDSAQPHVLLASTRGAATVQALLDRGEARGSFRIGWVDRGSSAGRPVGPGFTMDSVARPPRAPPSHGNASDDAGALLFTAS